jgi:hypothetical protein
MDFNEIIEQLKPFEGTDEYNEFLNGKLTAERINSYLDTEEGKHYVEPIASKRFTTGLETWKKNNLENLINEEVKKRYPDQTPEQKRIAELEAKFNEAQAKAAKSELIAHALQTAQNKKLPTDLIKYFVGDNQETTDSNIAEFETAFNSAVEKVVTSRMGESHKPDNDNQDKELTVADFENMSQADIIKYTNKKLNKA